MITLSDYLTYLSGEFLEARKRADEASVELAKRYAADEYLQHFKAPRFTTPVIKLKVPIRIDDVDDVTKYDFNINEKAFISELNSQLKKLARQVAIRLGRFSPDEYHNKDFQRFITRIDTLEQGFVSNIDHSLPREETDPVFYDVYLRKYLRNGKKFDDLNKDELKQLEPLFDAFYGTLRSQFKPVVTRLDRLHVTPQAGSLRTEENEKLLLHLEMEMVEEGLQIRRITDDDGNLVEEEISID